MNAMFNELWLTLRAVFRLVNRWGMVLLSYLLVGYFGIYWVARHNDPILNLKALAIYLAGLIWIAWQVGPVEIAIGNLAVERLTHWRLLWALRAVIGSQIVITVLLSFLHFEPRRPGDLPIVLPVLFLIIAILLLGPGSPWTRRARWTIAVLLVIGALGGWLELSRKGRVVREETYSRHQSSFQGLHDITARLLPGATGRQDIHIPPVPPQSTSPEYYFGEMYSEFHIDYPGQLKDVVDLQVTYVDGTTDEYPVWKDSKKAVVKFRIHNRGVIPADIQPWWIPRPPQS